MQQSDETLPDFTVSNLASDESMPLSAVAAGKALVVDFWTTKCVRCPAALSKLNDEAAKHEDVVFCSCVLDSKEIAADVIDGEWENMTHLFVDAETKDQLKERFQFSQVPFCIVVDKSFRVIGAGNPKDLNIEELLRSSAASGVPVSAAGHLVLDEDF